MPDTNNLGNTRLDCAILARALDANAPRPPVSDLPTDLQLPETAGCWVGPETPALIRLIPDQPELDSTPTPLLWVESADSNTAHRHKRLLAPVISTPLPSSVALARIRKLLDAQLDLTRPGTLVQVHGYGVLLQGESGVGKSETALMLLERGHQLITDDAVRIQAHASGALLGSAPGPLHGQLAVHGLGLLKVNELFGEAAVTSNAVIRLLVVLTTEPPPADPLYGAWTRQGWLGRSLLRLTLSSLRPRALLIETAVRQIQARDAVGNSALGSVGEQRPELV
ncbi:MAG: hypothetical protein J5I81_10450 [Nitrococcus mobilis]|nr:hypothetical protein [Nitrococcus mobilis]